MIKPKKNKFYSNVKSISIAVFIALLIRSFIFEPFNIPSGSMKPNLLVGDFIFVSKYSYGFSKHSLPFSLPLIPRKIFSNIPERGDIVVFKTPENNRTDYIKRVIGLPGDKKKKKNGIIFINGSEIPRKKLSNFIDSDINLNEKEKRVRQYREYFFKKEFNVLDLLDNFLFDNTQLFEVPENHFFVMGDNRDRSQDSRALQVGFVPFENLVGKAQFIFFSLENARFFQFWKWPNSIRYERIFQKIQ